MALATFPFFLQTLPLVEQRTAQLPPGIESVADLAGDFSIARCRSGSEGNIAEWLTDRDVGWYAPREIVTKFYDADKTGKRKKPRTWPRAFIPGVLFVADGWEGRVTTASYGDQHSDRLYGWIGHVYGGALGQQLRGELLQIERLLRIDPSLTAYHGVRRGAAVRVMSGPFEGLEGVVDSSAPFGQFNVVLKVLGQSIPVPVCSESLEPLN